MIFKLLLSSVVALTLAACQSPKVAETKTSSTLETVSQTKADTAIKINNTAQADVKNTVPANTNTSKTPEKSKELPSEKPAKETVKKDLPQSAEKSSGVIYLKEGENKFLKEFEMNVTFKTMIEDSRCPKDVNCIWEGVATAEVELMGLYTRPQTVRLNSMTNSAKGYSKSQSFNGYTISLVEVQPQTTAARGYNSLKGSYRIGIKISKGTDGNPSSGTTTR